MSAETKGYSPNRNELSATRNDTPTEDAEETFCFSIAGGGTTTTRQNVCISTKTCIGIATFLSANSRDVNMVFSLRTGTVDSLVDTTKQVTVATTDTGGFFERTTPIIILAANGYQFGYNTGAGTGTWTIECDSMEFQ